MQLIFIHGSGCTGRVWRYQSEYFPASISVTLPGHGTGELIGSVSGLAAWLKRFVDKNNLTELVLIGHSLGGGIALQYALDYPGDMRALVLVGSGARLRVHPDTLNFLGQSLASPERIAPMIRGFWHKVPADFASELEADSMSLGPAVFLSDLKACDQFDVMDRLGDIDVPTLAIVGTEDVMTPSKYAGYLVEKVRNAEIVVIDHGTHSVFAEYPEDVNGAIGTFLDKLG